MDTRNGATVQWATYHLPTLINGSGGAQAAFGYGPDRQRKEQDSNYVSDGASGVETTVYVFGLYESETTSYQHHSKYFIDTPGGTKVVYDIPSRSCPALTYITSDHLGSASLFVNDAGSVIMNESFSAYGYRRSSNWSGPLSPTASDYATIAGTTRRGYTEAFHESLDNLALIHMNGRVYDPVIGRFLSPDPSPGSLLLSQSWNPYSYVMNQPTRLTDPTGLHSEYTACPNGCHQTSAADELFKDATVGQEVSCSGNCGGTERADGSSPSGGGGGAGGGGSGGTQVASPNGTSQQTAAGGTDTGDAGGNLSEVQILQPVQPAQQGINAFIAGAFHSGLSGDLGALERNAESRTPAASQHGNQQQSLPEVCVGSGCPGNWSPHEPGLVSSFIGLDDLLGVATSALLDSLGCKSESCQLAASLFIPALRLKGVPGKYTLTTTVEKNLATRPYLNSPRTIDEIQSTGLGVPDPEGTPGALRYDVPGAFNGSEGIYELVIDPSNNTVYHFLFRSSP